jgi:hypothetical protein
MEPNCSGDSHDRMTAFVLRGLFDQVGGVAPRSFITLAPRLSCRLNSVTRAVFGR